VNTCRLFSCLLVLLLAAPAHAGNNGWFNTYNSEIEKGELEIGVLADFDSPSRFRRDNDALSRYNTAVLELEYSPTSRYVTELYVEGFKTEDTGRGHISGYRWENRYRLTTDESGWNPMLYLEYENVDARIHHKMEVTGWINPPYDDSGGGDREHDIDGKLILSRDFGPYNFAFNFIGEHNLDTGVTEFGIATGVMRFFRPGRTRTATSGRKSEACANCAPASKDEDHCCCGSEMKNCRCDHCNGPMSHCPCKPTGTLGLGAELLVALGDSKAFGIQTGRQEDYLCPVLYYQVNSRMNARLELPIGLTSQSDGLIRVGASYEY